MSHLSHFVSGPKDAVYKLNEIVKAVNSLNNFIGDGLILVNRTPSGYSLSLNVDGLKARLGGLGGSGGGSVIRKAYCKTDAGAYTSIDCYLDTDSTGEEVTVYCSIAGGNALNTAIPRLTDGKLIFVAEVDGLYHCLTMFQATEDCVCG